MEKEQAPAKSASTTETPLFQWSGTGHAPAEDPASPSGDEDGPASPQENKAAAPAQKRRRVTRACDECRRKKIKCDGKQPCTHCTVYSYECTYDQPSNRRRNPTPQYVEALESRLQRAEAILKAVLPNIDLNDPNVTNALLQNASMLKQPAPTSARDAAPSSAAAQGKTGNEAEKDSLLESMVQDTGSLDLDDEGHYDFHGHSSGMVFLQRLRQQFGDMLGQAEGIGTMLAKPRYYIPKFNYIDSPKSSSVESPFDPSGSVHAELPPREQGKYFCELSMSDACSLMRFIHKPTLRKMFDKIYDTPDHEWGNEEHQYLPLLFGLMAVGTMFAAPDDSKFQREGYAGGIENGFKWFKTSRQLLDVTDVRDVPSLQAIICMIMFLQSTAKLSTCWCYVGIALHSAIRMGLHRSIAGSFSPVELESRRRLFWQIRKMDVYVGAMIGLPTMLQDDDIDQDLPLDVDDEFITPERILPVPPGHINLMTASNAQTRLMKVLRKVIKYVYPIKGIQYMESKPRSYVVGHAKIREIERDLQHWMEDLPMFLRPGGEVTPELARYEGMGEDSGNVFLAVPVQQLLRMAYAYVQMFLYRPFLHYVSKTSHHPNTDKRSYACAAACVSVSRNVIHITQEMSRRGLLIGSFWFVMYTTFLAIMSLVFFALENPESKSSEEIIQDATTGKDILAGLAKSSMAADRCTQTLGQLFEKIPDRLKRGRAQSLNVPAPKKRQATSPAPVRSGSAGRSVNSEDLENSANPQRALSFPIQPTSTSTPQAQYSPNITFNDPFPRQSTKDSLGISSENSTTVSVADSLAFSHLGLPQSKSPQSTTYGLPDLSAVMFPSTDPFAYPNQPMMTLENNTFADTPDSSSTGRLSIPSPSQSNQLFPMAPQNQAPLGDGINGNASTGGFDPSLEAQIYDPLQQYMNGTTYHQQGMSELLNSMGPMGGQVDGVEKGSEGYGDWWVNSAAQQPSLWGL